MKFSRRDVMLQTTAGHPRHHRSLHISFTETRSFPRGSGVETRRLRFCSRNKVPYTGFRRAVSRGHTRPSAEFTVVNPGRKLSPPRPQFRSSTRAPLFIRMYPEFEATPRQGFFERTWDRLTEGPRKPGTGADIKRDGARVRTFAYAAFCEGHHGLRRMQDGH